MSQFAALADAKEAVKARPVVALTRTCSTFVPSSLIAMRRLPSLMPSMLAGVTVLVPGDMPAATYVWACCARLLALIAWVFALRNGPAAFHGPVMSFELLRTSIWLVSAFGTSLTTIAAAVIWAKALPTISPPLAASK